MTWHILRTRWGSELDVARGLSAQYETICPKRLVVRQTRHFRKLDEKALYSTYVFVCAPLGTDPHVWHDVVGMAGVVEIVGGEFPYRVTEAEIGRLLERLDENGYLVDTDVTALLARYRRGFDVGDQVRIVRGKWRGFQGEVVEITRDVVVAVKTALFRRETTLYALVDNCEVVEAAPEDRVPPELVARHLSQRRGGRRGNARRLTA